MNREQQRQNARDAKRIQQRQKSRLRGSLPSQPALDRRPGAARSKQQYAAAPQKQSVLPSWWPWAAAVAAVLVIVAGFYFLDPFGLRTPLPGKKLPTQGNAHVKPGSSHVVYNTDPPNSGPHFDTVPARGIYTVPFTTEYLPHFLEHGGVDVTYNSSASPEVVKKLTDIVNSELDKGAGRVLLAPRPDMPCQVAMTAWTRIETFGAPDCQPGSVGHDFDPKSSKDVQIFTDFVERNQCEYDPENACGAGQRGPKPVYPTLAPGAPTVIAALGTSTALPAGTPLPTANPTPASPTP